MKYIKWLFKNRFDMVMAILAAVAFVAGMIVAAIACGSLDKQHQAAVAAGVFDVCKAEAAEVSVVETAEKAQEPVPYWDEIPLDVHLQEYIVVTSKQYGIDPAIVMALIDRESGYNPRCVGDKGNSFGLCQIQPKWHYKRMTELGCTDLLDPYQNVTVAIDYLAELYSKYGDMAKALVAYNQGSYKGTVTQYAKNVMETAEGLVME